MKETNLADADLHDARPADSRLLNLHLNPSTDFGDRCGYDRDAANLVLTTVQQHLRAAATDATALSHLLGANADGRTPEPLNSTLRGRQETLRASARSLAHRVTNNLSAPLARIVGWPAAAIRGYRRWRFLRKVDGETADYFTDNYDQAQTTYRTYEQLAREHALPGKIPAQYVRGKDARRKQALAEGDTGTWARLAGHPWLSRYSESPWRVIGRSVATVLGSALLYPFAGIEPTAGGGTTISWENALAANTGLPGAAEAIGETVAESIYFSTVMFTTLGYGDVRPLGWAKGLATVESFLGALLMAYLVFVFGRRATR